MGGPDDGDGGEARIDSGPGADWAENRARELTREQTAPWGEKAMDAVRERDWEGALRCLDQALRIDPQDCVFWNDRGNVLRELGRHDDAIRSYERCLQINRWYSDAWLHLAQVHGGLGREAEELRCLQRFALVDFSAGPGRERCRARLKEKGLPELDLKEEGRFDEYLADFFSKMAVLGVDPKSADSWVFMAGTFEGMGRPDVTALCLERALELDARNADAWYKLGHMRLEGDALPESLRCFRKVLETDPGRSLAWWSKALVEERLGRTAEQGQSLRRFLALEPKGHEDLARQARETLARLGW